MNHLIRLLPDNIANQIAAGEVVQRPASVVKELLENAIDAGADRIDLVIKDAGKALVQVIDNGSGMNAQDARMAFERHATSKIRTSDDLFNIRTMGFRGEALASIAAVAQVQLKTRLHDEELGTEICIEGSEIKKTEPVMTTRGTSFAVKNLFFNVPARRNFLKTNPVETRHILNEFTRVAMAYPGISMSMEHNGAMVYELKPGNLEQRIAGLLGKSVEGKLALVQEETPYLKLTGLIGSPEIARKKRGEQYFFVNKRFIKSNYLNHGVTTAYKDLLISDTFPFYCIFLDISPRHIDINIHPTKTEIKFDDERTVYTLLHSVARKALAGFHQAPEMDFADTGIARMLQNQPPAERPSSPTISNFPNSFSQSRSAQSKEGWEKLYKQPERFSPSTSGSGNTPRRSSEFPKEPFELSANREKTIFNPDSDSVGMFKRQETEGEGFLVQLQNQFILSQSKSGLIIIDQCHAHQRVLFEQFKDAGTRPPLPSQQLLFPMTLEFAPSDFEIMRQIGTQIQHLGFDLSEFGKNTFHLHGLPSGVSGSKAEELFEEVLAYIRDSGLSDVKAKLNEKLAKTIALKSAMPYGKKLNAQEMRTLIDQLFNCAEPGISPAGKPTWYRLEISTLNQFFQRNT